MDPPSSPNPSLRLQLWLQGVPPASVSPFAWGQPAGSCPPSGHPVWSIPGSALAGLQAGNPSNEKKTAAAGKRGPREPPASGLRVSGPFHGARGGAGGAQPRPEERPAGPGRERRGPRPQGRSPGPCPGRPLCQAWLPGRDPPRPGQVAPERAFPVMMAEAQLQIPGRRRSRLTGGEEGPAVRGSWLRVSALLGWLEWTPGTSGPYARCRADKRCPSLEPGAAPPPRE